MCEFCAPWYDATRAAHVNIALKHKDMSKGRLEAFSDGVIAILITIMVLDLRVPHETSLAGLRPVIPTFFSYVLSYVFIGIYWNNHHHLLHAAQRVNGAILWANLHLLFWLSLVPFATGWMGQNHFAPVTVAVSKFRLIHRFLSMRFARHSSELLLNCPRNTH